MDFYTLKSKIDLTAEEIISNVKTRITHFVQMEIEGAPFKDAEGYVFRFAVRAAGLIEERAVALKDLLVDSIEEMTHENTSLEKADHI